jgi:FlaA1/EpsC-like NDP-sugar epimerase
MKNHYSSLAGRIRRSLLILGHDLIMIPVAWLGSYWFRFNLAQIPDAYWSTALQTLPWVILVQTVCFYLFDLHKGVWRFASLPDMVRIIKAVAVGTVACMALLFILYRLEFIPRSMVVLYPVLLLLLLSGPRLLYRWSKDHRLEMSSGTRVLIVGAGQAGEMLARDLRRMHSHSYQPVAFVDDKNRRQGQEVHGIPVIGSCDQIPEIVGSMDVDLIMLAIPSASGEAMRRLVRYCDESGVPFQTVPSLDALVTGKVAINELRSVSIEDILGREPVSLDWDGIRRGLGNKIILITGAGGSIGSELCRQVAALKPGCLVLLENSEFNLYTLEMELQQAFPELEFFRCLGDVRDSARVNQVFAKHRPDVVFHAAAYKHVPMLEHQIREAVKNNVLGTRTLALAADRHGATEFVLISTDKAVNPANVMGATKRVAEIFCQNLDSRSKTRFITVRFGNVLDSAGSVVPLFRRQIREGGPLTVTHADIERYFMTIPEAAQLILQASVLGGGGEIFVLDMGSPIRIKFLAEQMIRLSGKVPYRDIDISITGLRPGEKLYEELFHDQERLEKTAHAKILLARHRKVDWDTLSAAFDEFEEACDQPDKEHLLKLLTALVPENRIAASVDPATTEQQAGA